MHNMVWLCPCVFYDRDVKPFQQYLYSDYFFRDVERRVYAHGVTVRVDSVNSLMRGLHSRRDAAYQFMLCTGA
jgi:hypothetical protein